MDNKNFPHALRRFADEAEKHDESSIFISFREARQLADEFERLSGWLDYIRKNYVDYRTCAHNALKGDPVPDGGA